MRLAGLKGRSKGAPKPTRSQASLPSSNNLLKGNFGAARPDAVWVSDITYLHTQEGWLYLAVVLDLFSRQVVGRAMQARITTALTLAAPDMAMSKEEIAPRLDPPFGSRWSICQRRLPERSTSSRNACQHQRQLFRERCGGELLCYFEDRRGAGLPLRNKSAGQEVRFRLPGGVLQSARRHSSLVSQSPAAFEAAATLNQVSSRAGLSSGALRARTHCLSDQTAYEPSAAIR